MFHISINQTSPTAFIPLAVSCALFQSINSFSGKLNAVVENKLFFISHFRIHRKSNVYLSSIIFHRIIINTQNMNTGNPPQKYTNQFSSRIFMDKNSLQVKQPQLGENKFTSSYISHILIIMR